MNPNSPFKNMSPESLIERVRFRTEVSRFAIAVITIVFFILPFIYAALNIDTAITLFRLSGTGHYAFMAIGVFLLLMVLFIWLMGEYTKAKFLMNLIQVNRQNFPEIHNSVMKAKEAINYQKDISVYVSADQIGPIKALWRYRFGLLQYLDHRILVISSDALSFEPKSKELDFMVMFHIARLKTRASHFSILVDAIDGLKRFIIFSPILFPLIYPFERATVYTADRIATIYVGSITVAQRAIMKNMMGNELGDTVNIASVAEQRTICNPFFALLARLYSVYPGYSYRIFELGNFNSPIPLSKKLDQESKVTGDIKPWKLVSKKFGTITLDNNMSSIILGRDAKLCDYAIPKNKVSRQHVKVSITDNNLVVEDLGSTNGTYLDKKKMSPHYPTPVYTGTTISIAQVADFKVY